MRICPSLVGCALAIATCQMVLGQERASYPISQKSRLVAAQDRRATLPPIQLPSPAPSLAPTTPLPPSGFRGPTAPNFANPVPTSPPATINPGATGRLSDLDLSARPVPRTAPRTLSQLSSANRSATAFLPTNIFGDFFGGQSSLTTLEIPVSYEAVTGTSLGPNSLGFNVGGTNALDLFTIGGANDGSNVFALAEPLNPTAAYTPTADGITGYQFAGGTATPIAGPSRYDLFYSYQTTVSLPTSISSLYGRQKIAENVSPLPQNRLFVNYSYFDRTALAGGLDVKRWSPGFESLIGSERTSIEMRLPMATTLSSNVFSDVTDRTSHEIGNLYLGLKHLVYRSDDSAVSIGLSMTLPTADDISIFVRSREFGARRIIEIDNRAVHLLPFVGWLKQSNRFFTQGFLQLDIDASGNPVSFNPNIRQDRLVQLGTIQDPTFLYVDVQNGYQLFRSRREEKKRGVTSAAAVTEFHLNRSLQAEDRVFFPSGASFAGNRADIQILNALAGFSFEINYNSTLSLGYATPIGNGVDHEFKSEGRLLYNRYF